MQPTQPRDTDVIRRALAGDRFAETALAGHLALVPGNLAGMNARIGRPLSDHDLADVAQDTIVILLRKLRDGATIAVIPGWIYRVCAFEFMNAVRRKRKQPRISVDDLGTEVRADGFQEQTRSLDLEDVGRGLKILEPNEAVVIELKFFGDSTFEQIGERLGASESTIKTRFYRGLVKLHEFLKGRYGEEERHA